jgi:RNA polymerase sigma factor (sigma-70 family)
VLRHPRRDQTTASDESLLAGARSGDKGAFAVLWERHARSGLRVARQFTSSLDADDLVAEAFTQIYRQVLAGGGPDGSFRPYLYTTVRNLACRWGRESQEIPIDDLDGIEDPFALDDPAVAALDRSFTVRAFRSLPDRWQSVLWYTEVEGMDPHEVAPLLGLTPNSVAALSYRAREGLRTAWLQAHISDNATDADCRWAIGHLGGHARHGLTDREAERLADHLRDCTHCSIIAEEVDEVGSRLALVLLPLILGGVAGGTLLAGVSAPAGAAAAELLIPAIPPAFQTLAGTGLGTATAGLSLASAFSTPALVGSLAVVVALSGGLAVSVTSPPPASAEAATVQPDAPSARADSRAARSAPAPETVVRDIVDPASAVIPDVRVPRSTVGTVTGAVGSTVGTLPGVVDSTVGTATGAVGTTVGTVTGVVDSTVGTATGAVGTTVGSLTGVVDSTAGSLTGVVDSTVGSVTEAVGSTVDAVSGVTDTVDSTVDGVTDTVDSTVDTVTDVVDSTGSTVLTDTGGLLSGLFH